MATPRLTPKLLPITTSSSPLYIERAAQLMAASFVSDALNRYFIRSADSLPNSTAISPERWLQHFLPGVKKKIKHGGLCVEVGDWAGAAVWFPPGVKKPPLDSTAAPVLEYMEKFDRIKKQYLGGREYWYLNLIARDLERFEPGVARSLIMPFLQKAKEAGVPAFLESTNEHARDVYAHFGFTVVETVWIGQGKADGEGNMVEGGEGIELWAMIVEPKDIP